MMQKIRFFIILTVFSLISNAQVEYSGKIENQSKYSSGFVVGLNGNLLLPFGNLSGIYGPGFGGGVTAKYIIGGVFGIGGLFNYQLLSQSPQSSSFATHTLMNYGVVMEYYLNVGGKIVPYFGLDLARYSFVDHYPTISSGSAYGNTTETLNSGLGLAPTIGFIYQINKYVDSNVSFKYNHIFSGGYVASQLVSISVGLIFHITSE
jgi:hypothetical protein